jgi:hypothetical protein
VRLIDILESYFRGPNRDAADQEHAVRKEWNVCGTVNRSKIEQRQVRAELWRILDQEDTPIPL